MAVEWAVFVAVLRVCHAEVDVLVSGMAFREMVVQHGTHPRKCQGDDHQQGEGSYCKVLPAAQPRDIGLAVAKRECIGAAVVSRRVAGVWGPANSRRQ